MDPVTGEVTLEGNEMITEEIFNKMLIARIDSLSLLFIDNVHYLSSLRDTLLTDKVNVQDEALVEIYRKLRPGNLPLSTQRKNCLRAFSLMQEDTIFLPVGRLKINKRLGVDIPLETRVLTDKDIVEIVRYLLSLRTGKGEVDDIDHLGNRRIRGVGELLENQFRIGLVRMERTTKEKLSLTELDEAMPHDLINAKPVMAAVKGSSAQASSTSLWIKQILCLRLRIREDFQRLGPGDSPGSAQVLRSGCSSYTLRKDMPCRDTGRPQHRIDNITCNICKG